MTCHGCMVFGGSFANQHCWKAFPPPLKSWLVSRMSSLLLVISICRSCVSFLLFYWGIKIGPSFWGMKKEVVCYRPHTVNNNMDCKVMEKEDVREMEGTSWFGHDFRNMYIWNTFPVRNVAGTWVHFVMVMELWVFELPKLCVHNSYSKVNKITYDCTSNTRIQFNFKCFKKWKWPTALGSYLQ